MKVSKFLFVLLIILIAFSFVSPAKAESSCPDWLMATNHGKCLSSVSNDVVEGLPDYYKYVEDWKPGIDIISYKVIVGNPPLPALGGSNFNTWATRVEWLYVDERTINGLYAKTLYIGARLICDINGEKRPRLTVSFPVNDVVWRYPQNIGFTIVNPEILQEPCSY